MEEDKIPEGTESTKLEVDNIEVKNEEKVVPKEFTGKQKATITIKLFDGAVPVITFVGDIVGTDITLAFRSMLRSYRHWKAGQIK